MVALAAAALVALASQHCPNRTLGPGTQIEGGTKGAACLLAAYQRCRPAEYVLSGFAGGTAAIESFSVRPWQGGCAVYVIRSVGPTGASPVVTGPRICHRVRATAAGVVADRCTRGKPAVIRLTDFA